MKTSHITLLSSVLLIATASAAEVPVEPKPFIIESSFTTKVAPADDGETIMLEPKAWGDFQLLHIAPHGSSAKKSDVLMSFDPQKLADKIADTQRAVATATLALAAAEQELEQLKETAAHRLEAARNSAEIAKEELAYFTDQGREASEVRATQQLDRTEQYLENQKEELKQLKQMYAADDLTEETEEIILVRQKNDVKSAEIGLKLEALDHKRTMEVYLPRKAITLANQARDTAIALDQAKESIPRDIKSKELALESQKIQLERLQQSLDQLKSDQALVEIKAPADGTFYYGSFDQGEWITGDLIKTLVKNGRPPMQRPIATFIPASAKTVLVAFTPGSTARTLGKGMTGIAQFAGREDISIDASVTDVASTPDPKGRYRVELAATWPKELSPAIGNIAKVKLISYYNEEAITVPDKALSYGPKGWSVEVKLADGKTEARSVTRGRQADGKTEILKGLESGQVVVTPGS